MIDDLRSALEQLGEQFSEKNAAFKVKVVPFFCSVRIKKDHKHEGTLHFYANQFIDAWLVCLFILFGALIYQPELGLTHGPIHFAIAAFVALRLIIRQVAIESLKARLYLLQPRSNAPQSQE